MTYSCRVSFAILYKKENNLLLSVGFCREGQSIQFVKKG